MSLVSSSSWHSMTTLLLLLLGQTAIWISTFFVLSVSTVAIYRFWLHPLSHVPGPRLAALTNAWYAYQARNGRMLHLGTTLHQKYGPVVRVGPNELWLNSKDAFRLIYSQRLTVLFPPPPPPAAKLTSRQVLPLALKSLAFIWLRPC